MNVDRRMVEEARKLLEGDGPPLGPLPSAPKPGDFPLKKGATMPMRRLGRTGVQVSLLGLGGFHIGVPKDESEGVRIVREAVDHGVTFLDNCWDYNEGKSEERMGKALRDGYRDKVFLMTKIDARTADAARGQIEQSLRRLRTDVIDLVQIHEVIRESDADRVFGKGGTMEALLRAREQGKLRYIGFTGHKSPRMHRAMLEKGFSQGFTFDAVQMPLNCFDAHFDSFEREILPILRAHDIAVLGMKSMGDKMLLASGVVAPIECLRYSMSLPASVVITGCDSLGVLHQALHVALDFEPLTPEQRDELLARTRDAARAGEYERFKTSKRFDGTEESPHWMEEARL